MVRSFGSVGFLLAVTIDLVARGQVRPAAFEAPPIEVRGEPDEEAAEPTEAPASAFGTRTSLHRAQAEGRTLAEVLESLPSIRVRSLGGIGSLSSLSIRGSSPTQVLVLVDGVPVASPQTALASLGDLAIDGFSHVDVYRGIGPLALGGATIGGVVHLRSNPRAATGRLTLGAGSFGTGRIGLFQPARIGPWKVTGRASWLGTEGDFPFYDDRGTRQNRSDDRTRPRQNASFELLDAGGSAQFRSPGGLRLESSLGLAARRAGVPGLGAFQADHAESRLLRVQGAVSAAGRPAPATYVSGLLTLMATETTFEDRFNEIGLGRQERRDQAWSVALRVPSSTVAWGSLFELSPSLMLEGTKAQDPVAASPVPPPVLRVRAALGGAWERAWGRWTFRAAAQLGLVRDGFRLQDAPLGTVAEAGGTPIRMEPTTALGLRFDWARGTSLRTNLVRSLRSPTLEELFGASGEINGNVSLLPETALGLDLGVTLERARWRLVAAGFAQDVSDLIQWVQTSQRTAQPENIGRARLLGLEISGAVRPTLWLSGELAWTWLDARNLSERPSESKKRIPGRPEHDVYARLGTHLGPVDASADLDLVSGNFLDPANFQEVPPRFLLGLSLRLKPPRFGSTTVTLTVRNLLDHRVSEVPLRPRPRGGQPTTPQAVSDFAGFPLPGRSIFVVVELLNPREESP